MAVAALFHFAHNASNVGNGLINQITKKGADAPFLVTKSTVFTPIQAPVLWRDPPDGLLPATHKSMATQTV